MNVGVIPQHHRALEDNELFRFESYDPVDYYGVDRVGFSRLYERFDQADHNIGTLDRFDLNELDVCIFIDQNFFYLHRFLEMTDPPFLVYVMREPPSVNSFNSSANLLQQASLFDVVFTWNDRLSEQEDTFVNYNIPYPLSSEFGGGKRKSSEKLLVNVSSRKFSNHPDELYSARERIIKHFHSEYPERFTLYGKGWDKRPRIRDRLQYLKFHLRRYDTHPVNGDEKLKAYKHHKFALAFENMTGVDGYVTEKIFDCFRGGTVPIYWGADNITDYVPSGTFVDYREYRSPEALAEYIDGMSEETYRSYFENIRAFVAGDTRHVQGEQYAETIFKNVVSLKRNTAPTAPPDILEAIHVRGRLQEKARTGGFVKRAFQLPVILTDLWRAPDLLLKRLFRI